MLLEEQFDLLVKRQSRFLSVKQLSATGKLFVRFVYHEPLQLFLPTFGRAISVFGTTVSVELQRRVLRCSIHDCVDNVATDKANFRKFPFCRYLIVYEAGTKVVVIHYVRHGARRRIASGRKK